MKSLPKDWKGKWALVTGASSGMGVEYVRRLARAGVNVVATARRAEVLADLTAKVRAEFGVRAEAIACDLAGADAVPFLTSTLAEKGIEIDILINNAGFGAFGPFDRIDWKKEKAMLELDIVALVELTRAAAEGMKARKWGRILQVASIGAYQPTPRYASYAAAKAFVLNYGIAIARELAGSGVTVTVLSPGVTRTEFFDTAGQASTRYIEKSMMGADEAVNCGLAALAAGKSSVIPGTRNKILAFLTRFVPRSFAADAAFSLTR